MIWKRMAYAKAERKWELENCLGPCTSLLSYTYMRKRGSGRQGKLNMMKKDILALM